MTGIRSKSKRRAHLRHWRNAIILLSILLTLRLQASSIILHLKNGDRVAGELVSEDEQSLTVDTVWAKGLKIPRSELESRETLSVTTNALPTVAASAPTNAPTTQSSEKPIVLTPPSPVPKKPNEWKFDAKIGADMLRGEKDSDIYYGQVALTFAHPYQSDPKKFLRNKLDYRVDYSTTDGTESANRMFASDKTDGDFGTHVYAYNYVGGGYDEVRKINSQFEAGPGVGYHLIRKPAFVANVESGLTYQYQNREGAPELNSVYARFGEDFTWKIYPKITLTQRSSLLVSLEESDQLQYRFEANLSFGIVEHISLNLSTVELYDTRPVPGISRNEFQLRSSLGVSF